MSKLIEFLQCTFSIKVSRIISKFIFDNNGQLIYLGTNRLFVSNETEICKTKVDSIETWELLEIIKKRKTNLKPLSLTIEPPSETIKIFSDNLFSKLAIEECKGDFCTYEFLENSKGVLQLKKNEYKGQSELNCNHKLLGSIFSVILFNFSII